MEGGREGGREGEYHLNQLLLDHLFVVFSDPSLLLFLHRLISLSVITTT